MIHCDNINKAFGGRMLFRHFSYRIGAAGLYAVTGPSGCGKTTLARMIMGLEQPNQGSVHRKSGLRFSAVFPENRLISTLTALENVDFPVGNMARSRAMLQAMRLDANADQYPWELSSGMNRRVALARALSYRGDLLILDEPFNGLDQGLKEYILTLLLEYAADMPVVVLGHETELLRNASISFLNLEEYATSLQK